MKTVILAGGLGTRLAEETEVRPKPMIEIGGKPILWHIMSHYAAFGFNEFVIALGYRGDFIKHYFMNFYSQSSDLTIDLSNGSMQVHDAQRPSWIVHLVDTGLPTMTGGRLRRLRDWVGDGTFLMTYGDGVGNVDLEAAVTFHRRHGRKATVTAVRPPARFGGLDLDGDRVTSFVEKPHSGEMWVNGGYFVLEPSVLDEIDGDMTPWEREPVERLVAQDQLRAFRHPGFWHPMDTLRDKRYLEALWESGDPPWKVKGA